MARRAAMWPCRALPRSNGKDNASAEAQEIDALALVVRWWTLVVEICAVQPEAA